MDAPNFSFYVTPTNQPTDSVAIDLAGTTITVPAAHIAQLLIDKLQRAAKGTPPVLAVAPAIGSPWPDEGGIYAGVVRGDEGETDYHLIVLEEYEGELSWADALAWGQRFEDQRDLIAGLPKREEQALMFANVPELFQKTWYWSREQYAYDAEYAWFQYFSFGGQHYDLKGAQLRARAVRRAPIR